MPQYKKGFSTSELKQMANAIRVLAMDAVHAANSGHPGMPMGAADFASVLFAKHMVFNPAQPTWANRDRFVLSAGHGSMLLYAFLHLAGYADFPLEAIKNFRQLGSACAGHPEYGHGAGIEMTTGPLGQGLATAVGMALGQARTQAQFPELCDHYTYVIAGDGCLMEGVSHEAFSLAGHLRLHKLIVLFDDNGITIDGATNVATSDNLALRMDSYGWQYLHCDGHDMGAVDRAIKKAKKSDRPTLIACKTIIGRYAPVGKEGSEKVHGAPLNAQEIAQARKAMKWNNNKPFEIPEVVRKNWKKAGVRGEKLFADWQKKLALNANKGKWGRLMYAEEIKKVASAYKTKIIKEQKSIATRAASRDIIALLHPHVPALIGGSADLTHSNLTLVPTQKPIRRGDFSGDYVHYGVREFAMLCAMNGLSLYGGQVAYGATFMVFSDYLRPALRLSALMQQRVILLLTHDSIGLGEDGPTHQPVEHLAALRAMPNVHVFRPCDAVEAMECWQISLAEQKTPCLLALSRQNLPVLRTESKENKSALGAYVIASWNAKKITSKTLCLWASGSEVSLAREVANELHKKYPKLSIAIISVPCLDIFAKQDARYQNELLQKSPFHVVIEAGVRAGWEAVIGGGRGLFFGVNNFGLSAPQEQVYAHFGLTSTNIARVTAKKWAAKEKWS